MERTFVFIKPDGVERHLVGEIIRRFEEAGLTLTHLEMTTPNSDIINKHYPLSNRDYITSLGHVDTSNMTDEEKEALFRKNYRIVENLQHYIASGRIVKMILEGEGAVARVREVVGKTDPAKSPKGSIRGDLGQDSFEASDAEDRSVKNLVHASGTPDEAKAEIELWFA